MAGSDGQKIGNPAGTEGLSKRIEAIEIKVVTKGDTAPEMGKEAFVKNKNTGINGKVGI